MSLIQQIRDELCTSAQTAARTGTRQTGWLGLGTQTHLCSQKRVVLQFPVNFLVAAL